MSYDINTLETSSPDATPIFLGSVDATRNRFLENAMAVFFRFVPNISICNTLILKVYVGLFGCFYNPPNTDMDYGLFNVRS